MGIPWEEVSQHLGRGEEELSRMREGMEEKALAFCKRPDPEPDRGHCRRRAPRTRALLPPHLPTALLAVLTTRERQALDAYGQGATQTEAAREAGLSQPTLSRILSFVRENCQKPPDDIRPRTTRYKNDRRREQFLQLFTSRPAGELVTTEELLESFADVQKPLQALRAAVSRYSRQIKGARITAVKGQGYALVEEREA
jgi:transposase